MEAIDHCEFRDGGGSAILAGSFSPESMEGTFAYRPSDDRIVCRGLRISDNIITDAANEDWGCLGIGAGYVSDIDICHNEISDVSSRASAWVGMESSAVRMSGNHVWRNLIYHYARHLYDVAGIYTLGSQPGTVIEENTVRHLSSFFVHDTEHWFYLYTDEGSSHITLKATIGHPRKISQECQRTGNGENINSP